MSAVEPPSEPVPAPADPPLAARSDDELLAAAGGAVPQAAGDDDALYATLAGGDEAPTGTPDEPAAAPGGETDVPRTGEHAGGGIAPADAGASEDEEDERPAYPPVVAVLVTRNPGEWFEDTLLSLGAQDYPDLTVLVVDCSSDDDPTERVAAVLPRAFVRRVDTGKGGFATAANESLSLVEGAPFLLFCHDDVHLDDTVVRIMVEEAYRSNAAVLGPKLVSAENPEVLLEVGRAIDRFGAPYTGIEPGELDQEQHDGVRDVFYVPTATMLVRTDLFTALDGFDPGAFPGAEDLDLCWRARLVGARVLVVPDARVAHHEAADARLHGDRPNESAIVHTRVRTVLTSYSVRKLLWLVPVGVVASLFEALGNLLAGHPRRARAAIVGWWSNLLHLRSLRTARSHAQRLRTVHDSDLRELQIGTTTRVNAWFAHHLHTEGRLRVLGDSTRSMADTVSDGVRAPATIAFLVFLGLVFLGSRDLFSHGVPAIGTFGSWPSVGSLFDAFGSAWRYTGLGSQSAQPPALLAIGGLGTVFLGAIGLARTLFVVLAVPLGAVGMYRLSRRLITLQGPAFAAAIAYGVNPVARNSIAQGRLGPLVLFALLPFLLVRLVHLAQGDERKGRVLRLAVLAALLAAFYPLGLGIFIAVGALVLLAVPITWGARVALRAFGISVAASLLALVLLFPWPLAYASGTGDAGALGFSFRPDLSLSQVMRFDTGPATASWIMWGLVFAAAVPLLLATGERLAWAARAWVLALAGWAAVWVPSTFFPHFSVPAPEAGLTVAALGLALALGIGVSVLVDGVKDMRFGWRQPAAILGAVAVLLPVVGFVGDAFDGSWGAPSTAYTTDLAFTSSLAARGQFRMLWLGNPTVLPLEPVVLDDGVGYTLTRNGSGNVLQQWRAPEHDADAVLADAIRLAESGLTNRLGRMLAPMGVHYVVLPNGQGKDGGAQAPVPTVVRRAIDDQLDLAQLRSDAGVTLYENLAYAPLLSVVPEGIHVPAGSHAPNLAALGTDLSGATAVEGAATHTGTLLWSEAHNDAWEATAGHTLRHSEAFGWANGYRLDRRGDVAVEYTNQWQRWAFLAGMALIWLVVLLRWRATRTRRDPAARAAERERRRRERDDDFFSGAADDDTFYWERV
jgi:GT2 family glycosyltransferase